MKKHLDSLECHLVSAVVGLNVKAVASVQRALRCDLKIGRGRKSTWTSTPAPVITRTNHSDLLLSKGHDKVYSKFGLPQQMDYRRMSQMKSLLGLIIASSTPFGKLGSSRNAQSEHEGKS